MDDHPIISDIPLLDLTPAVRSALGQLLDENALLRASNAELREQCDELARVADTDALTPLPNRRRFMRELERVVGQANRHGTPAALLQIDVKQLRAINARHGRLAGDAALIHVARLLEGLIRATDMAARLDGDEFVLLLNHLDHNSAIETADRIAAHIARNPVDLGGHSVKLSADIGIATILAGDSGEDVLRRAQSNVMRAKVDA